MFTVVIPAFNRPTLLRNALISIAQQSRRDLISRVIVSENGLNRGSEAVCQEFPELRIEYTFQEVQMPVLQHLKWVLSQEQTGYVAMLCDDDWWDIHHLELAAESLSNSVGCVAYFSNFIYSTGFSSLKGDKHYDGVEIMHLSKSPFVNYKPSIYTQEDLFLFSSIITPFHFSAMVCRGDVLVKSVWIFDKVHPTYADRILYPIIGGYGNVVFNPLKTSIVLFHQNMDSHNYNALEWRKERQNGSLQLIELASDADVDIKLLLNNAYANGDAEDKLFIMSGVKGVFYERGYINWFVGINDILQQDIYEAKLAKNKNSVKQKMKNKIGGIVRKLI